MNQYLSQIGLLLVFILCGCSESVTQGINGSLTFRPLLVKQIYLYEKIGNRLFTVDSAVVDQDGRFSFLTDKYPRGYYQLVLNDTSKVNIILDPSEAEVNLEFSDPRLHYSVKVVSSKENQILWEYKSLSKSIFNELNVIQNNLNSPDIDSVASVILRKRKDSLRQYKQGELDRLCSANPNSFFTKVVRASLVPEIKDAGELKVRYFENLDFSDAELIRSSVFPGHIMGFLKNHTEFTEIGFRSTVDTILQLANVNSEVYQFCVGYLLEIFHAAGPEVVFQYIVEQYLVGDGCSEIELSELMIGKAESYARLLPGKTAPNITVPDVMGSTVGLKNIVVGGEINLLFFWSSHCGYCEDALPELKLMYEQYKGHGMQIIAVSLDENKREWLKSIEDHELDSISMGWKHLSELKGWKSPIAKLYKISRTPSFYLLASDMEIIARPRTVEELKASLDLLK